MENEDQSISNVDLIKAAVILRPGVSTRTIAAITGLGERHVSATLSRMKSFKEVSMKMYHRQAFWSPLKALKNGFRVTNEMVARLGLNETGSGGRRRKGVNTVFDECRKSEAMQRVWMAYGRFPQPQADML